MASLSFKLRKTKTIYYRFTNGRETVLTLRTPYKLNNIKEWNQKKQLIKSSDIDYQINLNDKLSRYKTYILNKSSLAIVNGTAIDIDWLKELHNSYFYPNKSTDDITTIKDYTLTEYTEVFIKHNGFTKQLGTVLYWLKQYKAISISKVDYNWFNAFVDVYIKKEYAESTINKQVQLIRGVLRFAKSNNIKINNNAFDFKDLKKTSSLSAYLNNDELDILFNYKCKSDRLENIRKLFLIGCTTGLRVSDLMKINSLVIDDNFIEITTQKTKQSLLIPIDPRVKDYIKTIRPISHPVFNRYLKELCQLVGINEPQQGYIRNNKNRRVLGVYPKYNLITSHTMRRSFASNLYGKVPTVIIMAVTGHTTEKSFLNYIKKPQRNFAEQLQEYYFENEKRERSIA